MKRLFNGLYSKLIGCLMCVQPRGANQCSRVDLLVIELGLFIEGA